MRKLLAVSSLMMFTAGAVLAQGFPRFAFNLGGGFTNPVYDAGDHLDKGWNFDVGAGVNFHPHFGLMVDYNLQGMNIGNSTLNSLGFPGGDVQMWSLSLDPIVHLNRHGPVDVYFTGGGGFYHWHQEFTQPATATFIGFDPYFGVYYPVAVPVNQVVASYSTNKPGFDGGMGIAFGPRHGASLYTEARFHRMIFGNNRYVDTIPVTFGIRF